MQALYEGIKGRALIALLLAMLCCGCKQETGPDEQDEPDGPAPVAGDTAWPEDALRLEETDLDTVYGDGWVHGNTAYGWSGGTAAHTRVADASMSLRFTGTQIRWIGWRESTSGIARVWIDGEPAGEVDLYTNGLKVQVPVFTSEVLEQGQHTLTIKATGRSNPASTGTKVVVDAFEIVDGVAPPTVMRLEETFRTLSFSGEWHSDTACPACSGGANVWARGPDALMQLGFNGTRVRWLGWRKQLAGIARVYLDGAFAAEVDLYTQTPSPQAPIFTSEILDNGPHTLVIEIPGAANPAAGDSIVSLDAFDVAIVEDAPALAYSVTDLSTLGGAASSAKDINNHGEVVGWANFVSGERRAFLYRESEGFLRHLGTLTGGTYSEAAAINDHGHIVGLSGRNPGPPVPERTSAFVWQAGIMDPLEGIFCPCSPNEHFGVGIAYGINNSSQTVGRSETIAGPDIIHATLWNYHAPDAGMVNLGEDIGSGAGDREVSRAFDINDSGKVVGDYMPEGTLERLAFLWKEGTRSDLGRLPGHISSTALAINGEGAVAGWSGSLNAAVSRAVLWRDGTVQDLGVLPGDTNSQALDINASGHVVGWSGEAITIDVSHEGPGSSEVTDPAMNAFLWRDGQMIDLNRVLIVDGFGWTFVEATAINDEGQIVGTAFHNGQMRGFLLTPVP